jgi:hypothetical protein
MTGASNPFWHGTIAATPGQNNLNITDSWAIMEEDYPYVGQAVFKTGMMSGTTWGATVQYSCKDLLHSVKSGTTTDYWLLCQGVASSLYIKRGDSGSPIVTNASGSYPGVHNPVRLLGLLWGGPKNDGTPNTTAYFSPWPLVKYDLGGNMETRH